MATNKKQIGPFCGVCRAKDSFGKIKALGGYQQLIGAVIDTVIKIHNHAIPRANFREL